MAFPNDTIVEIIKGVTSGEHVSDVLHMCFSVAVIRLARGRTFQLPANDQVLGNTADRFDLLLRGAGLALCPIFDPFKHQHLQTYVEQMTAVRRSYRGIAEDQALKREFDQKIVTADDLGALSSLRAADVRNLPSLLSRLAPGAPRPQAMS